MDIATGDANDPAFLEQLMQASVPVTLAEGDRKVQDLRIAGLNRPSEGTRIIEARCQTPS